MNETDCDAGVESMMRGAKYGLKISAFWWNNWGHSYVAFHLHSAYMSSSVLLALFLFLNIRHHWFFPCIPLQINNSVRIMHRRSRTSLMAWNDMTFSRMLSVQQIYTAISTARPIIAISWHQEKNEMALPVFMTRRHEITYS